jgi:hypothetical protein
MTLHFKFICNLENYNYDSPNYSFHYAFAQFTSATDSVNMNMWNFKHSIKNINKNKMKSINGLWKYNQFFFIMAKGTKI